MSGAEEAARRPTIRLGLECNNHCVFCAQDGLTKNDERVEHAAFDAELAAARRDSDELTFVGGEPTLDATLVDKVKAARAVGFRRVGVQTNGSRLADASYTRALVQAGLTDVHLSLHGSDATVHDYHTGRSGSFGEILAALHAARTHDLPVAVTSVLTRSNFRVMASMPPLLAARGVAAWFIGLPFVAGRAATLRDRVVPRLGLAVPFALHALGVAEGLRLPSFIVGAPLCLLGPFAARALAGEPRAYGAACESCGARPMCPGIDPAYLARFDGDELSARDAVPRPAVSDLEGMFVGAGELFRSADSAAPAPSAARARRALPMLGKVKPAVAEAQAGSERRTGEALREILPALWEAGEVKADSKG